MRADKHLTWCAYRFNPRKACTCQPDQEAEEDERIASYTRTQPKVGPLSDPQGPYQTLASMIRAARRAGHLRPLQPYGGGHAPAFQP
jgi:hypothetical protein